MNPLRILIIAADALARAGLAALLASEESCLIVGQVAHITDWDEMLELYRPAVALWDLGWENTAELTALTTLSNSGLPLLALVADDSSLSELLPAGVRGILLRDADVERLLLALTAVTHNLLVLDPAFELGQTAVKPGHPFIREPIEPLTPRELEVLHLLTAGLTNKAIGQALNISQHTVKFHVSAIISKLGAQSRTEAVVLATRMGLLPL